jgi:hypothetical protein
MQNSQTLQSSVTAYGAEKRADPQPTTLSPFLLTLCSFSHPEWPHTCMVYSSQHVQPLLHHPKQEPSHDTAITVFTLEMNSRVHA